MLQELSISDSSLKNRMSCDFLESNRIVFFNNGSIRPCCRLQEPFFCSNASSVLDFNLGGAFHLPLNNFSFEKYLCVKTDALHQFSEGNFHGCAGCQQLKKINWTNNNETIKYIDFAFYSTCNLQCICCPLKTWYDHPINDFYQEVLLCVDKLLSERRIDNMANITFSGGEPTLLPDLNKMCNIFRYYSDKIKFSFLTNGVIFSDTIVELAQSGFETNVCISIDSGTKEGFYRVKGVDKFHTVIENIQRYKKILNSNLILKFIIIEENVDQIPYFFHLCKKIGVPFVSYDVDFMHQRSSVITKGIHEFCYQAKENNILFNCSGVSSQ